LTRRVRFRAAERDGDGNLDSLGVVLSPPAALTPPWKSQACRKDTIVGMPFQKLEKVLGPDLQHVVHEAVEPGLVLEWQVPLENRL
jgi:hypothetical protein